MPADAPARLPLDQALDEALAGLFRRLQVEPAPAGLIRLVDRLEAAARTQLGEEARSIG